MVRGPETLRGILDHRNPPGRSGDTVDFDVTDINADSLILGYGSAPNISQSPLYGDYDGDSNTDAAYAFQTQETGIFCDDPDVPLQGATVSGKEFAGFGSIETTDCDSGGCHP